MVASINFSSSSPVARRIYEELDRIVTEPKLREAALGERSLLEYVPRICTRLDLDPDLVLDRWSDVLDIVERIHAVKE